MSGAVLRPLLLLVAAATATPAHAGPPNDEFAGAQNISTLPFRHEVDATAAGLEPGEPKPPCAFPGQSVWYRLPAAAHPRPLAIDTFGSAYNTALTLWSGDELPALQHAACNDDVHGYKMRSRILFTPQADRAYYLQVSAPQLNGTNLVLNVREVPAPASLERTEPFAIHAADGTLLAGHVYLPKRPGKKRLATVLELSPYWNTLYIASDAAAVKQEDRETLWRWLGPYLDAGFAVALVNMRGTGLSGGCMEWGSANDRADAARVVEALAAQGWSNGTVGMIGLSFPGWTPFLAAAEQPRALKAIVAMSGVVDPYKIVMRNGASRSAESGLTTFNVLTRGIPYASATEHDPVFVPPADPWREAACGNEYAQHQQHGTDAYLWGGRTPWWDERDLRPLLAGTGVAVLATTGFMRNRFPEVGDTHDTQLDDLWGWLGGDKRFMFGQWPHDFPQRDDFADMAVAWFDHYLRGGPQLVAPGIVEYQDVESDTLRGTWHQAPSWPPPHRATTVYFAHDGRVVANPDEVAPSTQTFASTELDVMPHDCPGILARYISPPLAEDVWLAGGFTTVLELSSTHPDGNLLVSVHGRDGVAPCGDPLLTLQPFATEAGRALGDILHRRPDDPAKPFPISVPGVLVTTGSVELHGAPFVKRVRRGERLVVLVGTRSVADSAPVADKPLLTVHTGPGLAGSLTLPVVSGTLRFQAEPVAAAASLPLP